ncbi:MAG: hypothetical protein ACK47V_07345, partial [Betaproteobacteria bacterium]
MNAIVVATSLLSASLAATPALAAQTSPLINTAAGGAPTSQRQVITSSEQLPRRVVKLDKLPSQYLEAPRAEVLALADTLEKNLRDDLARFDIQDAATMRGYIGSLLTLAQYKGDWAAVPGLVAQLKALQDKPGPRATTGTMATIVAEQQTGKRDAAWVQ